MKEDLEMRLKEDLEMRLKEDLEMRLKEDLEMRLKEGLERLRKKEKDLKKTVGVLGESRTRYLKSIRLDVAGVKCHVRFEERI